MSKDYYMSFQEPLFSHINIRSFGKLVKLVGILTKPPIVSQTSAQQRFRWQSLGDTQLRERDVKQLNVLLDSERERSNSKPVNGELLSRYVGVVSRWCSGVRICLSLHGPWYSLLQHLRSIYLPDVCKLMLYLGDNTPSHSTSRGAEAAKPRNLWELRFSDSVFPDLQVIEFDTNHICRKDLPATISDFANFKFHGADIIFDQFQHNRTTLALPSLYGLKKMKYIKLRYNTLLDVTVLRSLLGSGVISLLRIWKS